MSSAKYTVQRRKRSQLERAMKGIGPRPGTHAERIMEQDVRRAANRLRRRERAAEE